MAIGPCRDGSRWASARGLRCLPFRCLPTIGLGGLLLGHLPVTVAPRGLLVSRLETPVGLHDILLGALAMTFRLRDLVSRLVAPVRLYCLLVGGLVPTALARVFVHRLAVPIE